MIEDKIRDILRQGESRHIEFKTAKFELNRDVFESICAFLNREGGILLLGVKNTGEVEGDQRRSLRDLLFREIVSNLLIHREFSNAYPAKLIIEADQVLTENWNRPRLAGIIDPANFTPYPKNPVVARFFKEIGWVDELGSGVRNIYKYCSIYTPLTQPVFIEGDIFKTIIPLTARRVEDKMTDNKLLIGVNGGLNEGLKTLLAAIEEHDGIQSRELSVVLSNRPIKTIERQIAQLVGKRLIERRGSRKTGGYWKIKD